MTVSVEMVVARRDGASTLPAWAIRDAEAGANPGAHVLVMREGRAVRQPVKLGLRGVGIVEIVEGLAEGDLVITPDSGAVAGERVRLPGPRARLNMGEVPGTR
jgi:HlyD family secretion protein